MASRAATLQNLREFVTKRTGSGVFTFNRLMQVAQDDDQFEVAESVADLVHEGLLEQLVVVESPSGKGGIGEYQTILDVPQRIHDWRTDLELEVGPEDIKVMYRLP